MVQALNLGTEVPRSWHCVPNTSSKASLWKRVFSAALCLMCLHRHVYLENCIHEICEIIVSAPRNKSSSVATASHIRSDFKSLMEASFHRHLKSARALTLVTRISLIQTHLLSKDVRKCTSEQKFLGRDCVAYTIRFKKPYGSKLPPAFEISLCTYLVKRKIGRHR